MIELEQLNKLEFAWLEAKRNWEASHNELDNMMSRHLQGVGPAPSSILLNTQNDLFSLMRAARDELDQFMRMYAYLLKDSEKFADIMRKLLESSSQNKDGSSSN